MASSPHDHGHAASNDPHAPDPHEIEHIKHHLRTYWIVFISLFVLTGITYAAALLPFSMWGHIITALFIATIKVGLVVLFFMHVITEKKLVVQIIILSLVCGFILFGLTWLAWYDPIVWGQDPYKPAPSTFQAPHH